MKRRTFCALLPAAAAIRPGFAATSPAATRERLLFDADWRFLLDDPPGAESPSFDAKSWRTLDLPHDWSIELKMDAKAPEGGSGGYFPGGIAWYRRAFHAPAAWSGKRVRVEFEGVYMNASVYINGHDLGAHPYGYTAFFHDLTPHLQPGENVLAVRVDQSQHRNSRWYAGAGIYRHVWLHVTEPVHVAPWGVAITTPAVSAERATVTVKTKVANESAASSTVVVHTSVVSPSGSTAGEASSEASVTASDSGEVSQQIEVNTPALWAVESPSLYRVVTRVLVNGKAVDEVATPFGIRSLEWSSEKGLLLNGKSVKLAGGCVHHDNGPLGAAAFDRAEERRVQVLKEAGFTCIRASHNPPSPAFLDACDRLGMMVLDEAFDCWSKGKNTKDYNVVFKDWWQRDLDAMVLRDRNHPCVVMWSIGNEIPERGEPLGAQEARMLADYLRGLDPTRPITSALNLVPNWTGADGFYAALDIGGYNYNLERHADDRKRVPTRIMACTESYPRQTFDYWAIVNDNPYVVGDFVWTALDYLGESGLGRWYFADPKDTTRESYGAPYPCHGSDCGDIDICGFRKAASHYRNVVWDRGEKLYLGVRLPAPEGKIVHVTRWGYYPIYRSWTWPGMEGKPLEVEIYSRYPAVRLYLGNQAIGDKPTTHNEQFKANFTVPYAPGVLKVVGLQDGREIGQSVLDTVGPSTAVKLTADRVTLRADGQDLAYITVEAADAHGRPDPNAAHKISFKLEGPGSIAAVGSGDMFSEEPYHSDRRMLFRGKALVVVRTARAAGALTLTASAEGLKPATLKFQSRLSR